MSETRSDRSLSATTLFRDLAMLSIALEKARNNTESCGAQRNTLQRSP
jgi:hypothetical protein